MDLYRKALAEKQNLEEEIASIRKRLTMLPSKSLVIHKGGVGNSCFKWFERSTNPETGKTQRKYIPRSQKDYASALAERTFLSLQLRELVKRQSAVTSLLLHYPVESEADHLLKRSPGFRELLLPSQTDISAALLDWQNYPYEINTYKLENKIVPTLRGEQVRSKAEAMIADTLYRRKIVYRHDCALYLGGTVIYPDFIAPLPGAPVLPPSHQLTEKDVNNILIIEHNGKMDDPKYVSRFRYKSGLYYEFGFMPSINMIMTFETKSHPFDLSYFTRELDYYFN